jgi:hypothetical protein
MPVDRCFANPISASSGCYRERAVTRFIQLFEHRLQNHLSRAPDSLVNSRLSSRRIQFAAWMTASAAQPVAQ